MAPEPTPTPAGFPEAASALHAPTAPHTPAAPQVVTAEAAPPEPKAPPHPPRRSSIPPAPPSGSPEVRIPPSRPITDGLGAARAASPPSLLPIPALELEPYAPVLPSSAPPADHFDAKAAALEWAEHLARLLGQEKDPLQSGRLSFERARILEYPLKDLDGALAHYQKAYESLPNHDGVTAGLLRVSLLQSDFTGALRWIDLLVKQARRQEVKAQRLLMKGYILEDQLSRPAEARKAYEQALEAAPGDASILRALSRRLRSDRAWLELDNVLAKQAELGGDGPLRAARIARRARTTEVRRKKPDSAQELYELAVRSAPDSTAALVHAERLQSHLGRFAAVAETLGQKANLVRDPETRAAELDRRAHLEFDKLSAVEHGLVTLEQAQESHPEPARLAQIAEQYERSGHVERALQTWARLEQVAKTPEELGRVRLRAAQLCERTVKDQTLALAWYERARESMPSSPDVALPLQRLYRAAGAYGQLVQVLLTEEAASTDVDRRAQILCEVAEVFETRLGSAAEARHYYAQVLAIAPGHGRAERALVRLYESARMIPELIELLERMAETAPSQAIGHQYLLRVAAIYEMAALAHDKALSVYRRILADDPSHLLALHGAQAAAERSSNYEQLVIWLQAEAKITTDPGRKASLLLRAGDSARIELGDPARAKALYDSVLGLVPRSLAALRALGRLLEEQGLFDELLETRKKEAELLLEPKDKAQAYLALANLCEGQLRSPEAATQHLKKALQLDPAQHVIADRLTALYAQNGQHVELERHLTECLDRAESPERRLEVGLRLGRLLENTLDKPLEALQVFSVLLTDHPHHSALTEARVRLLGRTGRLSEYVDALQRRAQETKEPKVALWSTLAAAEVLADELEKGALALVPLESVTRHNPKNPLAQLLLEELLGDLGKTTELHSVLSAQVEQWPLPDQIAALRERSRRESAQESVPTATQILERAPDDLLALELKERASLASQDSAALAQASRVLAQDETQPLVAAQHWTRAGEIWEPGDPRAALLSFQKALRLDSENMGAARGLGRVAERLLDPKLLMEAAEVEAKVSLDPPRGARLLVKASRVLDQAGHADAALNAAKRALELNPNDTASASLIVELLARHSSPEQLAQELLSAAQNATDAVAARSHFLALAKVYAEQLGDIGAAITALSRSEKRLPSDPVTLRALGELHLQNRSYSEAATKLEQALSFEKDLAARELIQLKLAEIYADHLSRPESAQKHLDQVLSADPKCRPALRRLLHLQLGRKDPKAIQTVQAWVALAEGAELAQALTTLGRLLRDSGDRNGARDAFQAALPYAGASTKGPLSDLLALLGTQDKKDLERSVSALQKHVENQSLDAVERAKSALGAGQILRHRLHEPGRAVNALDAGLLLDPKSTELRVALVEALEAMGQLDRATLEAQTLVATESQRAESWSLLKRLFEKQHLASEATLASGVLLHLGQGSDADRAVWQARTPRTLLVAPGAARNALHSLADPIVGRSEAMLALLGQLSELGPKLVPNALESLGLSSRDRITAKQQHPQRTVLDKVLRAFGVEELDLYLTPQLTSPRLVLSDPLGIAVPVGLATLPEAAQAFALAELVALVALGAPLVGALGEGDVLRFLVAGAKIAEPRFALTEVPSSAQLEELARRIAKAPSWLSRGKLEDAARRYVAQPGGGGATLTALRNTARSVALLLADDLSPLELLKSQASHYLGVAQVDVPQVEQQLLANWLSAGSRDARRQVGLGA